MATNTMLVKCVSGMVFLASLFLCPTGVCAALLLAVWTIGMLAFACSNVADRFLWIPPVVAFTGIVGLIFILAEPNRVTLAAEEAMLIIFVLSLGLLKKTSNASIQPRA
jgi:hypothetical protein